MILNISLNLSNVSTLIKIKLLLLLLFPRFSFLTLALDFFLLYIFSDKTFSGIRHINSVRTTITATLLGNQIAKLTTRTDVVLGINLVKQYHVAGRLVQLQVVAVIPF